MMELSLPQSRKLLSVLCLGMERSAARLVSSGGKREVGMELCATQQTPRLLLVAVYFLRRLVLVFCEQNIIFRIIYKIDYHKLVSKAI